jgi:hypothetical protein
MGSAEVLDNANLYGHPWYRNMRFVSYMKLAGNIIRNTMQSIKLSSLILSLLVFMINDQFGTRKSWMSSVYTIVLKTNP